MLKATAQEGPQKGTKGRIIEAALETLREDGFAGASARTIAKRGGFNQALIFYHFGTVNDLLLAALDRTSELRMAKYGEAVKGVDSVGEAIQVATDLYREDLASGHITVLSELIAGSLVRPELGPQIVERMEPWIDLAESAVRNAMGSIGLVELVPPRTIAYAIVALYLGVDLLSHLEDDNSRAEAMFASAQELGGLLSRLGGNAGNK
ncbi:MAG: TetR/AcrR family transcriptional regulator [Actinomycetota bacterium]